MCRVLSLWNSSPSALTERIADMANSPLQQAWIAGRLPANVKKNLDTKQGIHHTCARVAAQTRHTSAGEVRRQLYAKRYALRKPALLCVGMSGHPVTTGAVCRAASSRDSCHLTCICRPVSPHTHSCLLQVSEVIDMCDDLL